MQELIQKLPKAELHLHIEGSLEPELMFELAERNKLKLPFATIEEVRGAYQFENLQSFLDIYYQGANVLQTEQDFFDLTMAYLEKVASQNVRHVEIFFDPQTHTDRGIAFETVIQGIHRALEEGRERLGISFRIIMCFLRHLSEEAAFVTLEQAEPFKDLIIGVGLDSSEQGHPPEKFERVFARAREQGYLTVAHGGEEGPAEYIWQCINKLSVKRVDHGVRCFEDPELVQYLREHQVPLTVCPLSNIKLRVFDQLKDHCLKKMLDEDLCATINSDDPSYFGGYLEENYLGCQRDLGLTAKDLATLAKNSFKASFLNDDEKNKFINEIDSITTEYEAGSC